MLTKPGNSILLRRSNYIFDSIITLHVGCIQYVRSRCTIGRVNLSDPILGGKHPSLNGDNLFLNMNCNHWCVQAITNSWGTKQSNSLLYVHSSSDFKHYLLICIYVAPLFSAISSAGWAKFWAKTIFNIYHLTFNKQCIRM